ncbi:MAG: hypothetical protein WC028_19055 [Candidatus Obscuribacterales bacterium]
MSGDENENSNSLPDAVDLTPALDWKFQFNRLMPAALINATLTALCVFLSLYFAIVIALAYNVFESSDYFGEFFECLAFIVSVLAPVSYRMIWHALRFERSPGEQWLLLHWPVQKKCQFQVVLKEIAVGLVATLIALASFSLCKMFVDHFFGHSSIGLAFMAGWTMVPLVYCSVLMLFMLLGYRKHSAFLVSGSVGASFNNFKNATSLKRAVVVFCMPFVYCTAGYLLTPAYFSTLRYQSATWLILMIVMIWWAAGAVIVRYWDSRNSYMFYLFFFLLLGGSYLGAMPAVSGAFFTIGP